MVAPNLYIGSKTKPSAWWNDPAIEIPAGIAGFAQDGTIYTLRVKVLNDGGPAANAFVAIYLVSFAEPRQRQLIFSVGKDSRTVPPATIIPRRPGEAYFAMSWTPSGIPPGEASLIATVRWRGNPGLGPTWNPQNDPRTVQRGVILL